jgi:hypothetical protein
MSDSGLFSKLKNKVAFKVNQAVEDPEAEKYAKEQAKSDNSPPRVKTIEEIRQDRFNEFKKDKDFEKNFGEIAFKLVPETAIKKFTKQGKSEKEANELTRKYFDTTLLPLINKSLDEGATANQLIRVLEDQLDILEDDSDPNTISPSRIAKKIWRYIVLIVEHLFFPLVSIIVSMYIANEMIVYPAPIRAIFFVVTMVACLLFQPVAMGLIIFYMAKSGYSYYVNEMTAREKKRIMPTIFSILPISTHKPEEGTLSYLLYYPFTYPKTKKDEEELPKIMEEYELSLKESFPYLEKIKSLPFVAEGLELIKKNLEELHQPKEEKAEEPGPVPETLVLNNETRKQFNRLTSNQLPPTIDQGSKPSENAEPSSNTTNKNVPPPVTNNTSKNTQAPSNTTNKNIPPPVTNNTSKNTQAPSNTTNKNVPPPPFNNTTNKNVSPPPFNNTSQRTETSSTSTAPPPFNNTSTNVSSVNAVPVVVATNTKEEKKNELPNQTIPLPPTISSSVEETGKKENTSPPTTVAEKTNKLSPVT